MKKTLYLCIFAILISMIGTNIKPITLAPFTFDAAKLVDTTLNAQPTLKLVFNDEFNSSIIRTTKWTNQLQWGRTNYPELQYYDAKLPFLFSNGNLLIKAQKKWTHGMPYFSGVLTTYNRFKFTYGIVTIRARIPAGKGLWPAFWLLDYAGGAQEIDIMEALGQDPNIIYMTLHYPTSSGNKSTGTHYHGPKYSNGFHIYKVDWRPNAIDWYIDGVKRYTLTSHIPTKPMYLIMNLAVGGYWPGDPDSTTPFPSYLKIDYVRIYKRQ